MEFWYYDQNKMILENESWDEYKGKGDSVGRNAFLYICQPQLSFLKETLMACVKVQDNTLVQTYRYPNFGADTQSRDHLGAIILALYINHDWEELSLILDNLPWRISRKYRQTIDFWLWHKSINPKVPTIIKKIYSILFLIINILLFLIIIPYNKLIRLILGIYQLQPIYQSTSPNKRLDKNILARTIYPGFAFFLLTWQLKTIPENWLKKGLKRLLSFELTNPVTKHLLKGSNLNKELQEYKPMIPFLWSGYLDNSSNRSRTVLETEQGLDLNKIMLQYLNTPILDIMLKRPINQRLINNIKTNNPITNF